MPTLDFVAKWAFPETGRGAGDFAPRFHGDSVSQGDGPATDVTNEAYPRRVTDSGVRRISRWVMFASLGIALLASLAFSYLHVFSRPLGVVEGLLVFEASRLREGLTLYVDPLVGARDYGPVPARYYVLYPPFFSWILAQVPAAVAGAVGRALVSTVWLGLLAWLVSRARPANRRVAFTAGLYLGGVCLLARGMTTLRPDAIALMFAGIALERSVRRNEVDGICGALFALAAWFKPNVLSIGAGVVAYALLVQRVNAWRVIAGGLLASIGCAAWVEHMSHGAWLDHLVRSTAQALSLSRWLEQFFSRLLFLGLPHAFVGWCAWRARRTPGIAIAFVALVTSLAWTSFSMAKSGSAVNYWGEPSVAMLVVLAHAPLPDPSRIARVALSLAGAVFAIVSAVASVLLAKETLARDDAGVRAIARARSLCKTSTTDVVIAGDPGVEMMLNGRVVATPFQTSYLVRHGKFPLALWKEDIERPEVSCLVLPNDILEHRPPTDPEEMVETTCYGIELHDSLNRLFYLASRDDGMWIYRRR